MTAIVPTREPIELITSVPMLYYAMAMAELGGTAELGIPYVKAVRDEAERADNELWRTVIDAEITAAQRKECGDALEVLRSSPPRRARFDQAARVIMNVPAKGAGALSEDRAERLNRNQAAALACAEAEHQAMRTLTKLLHTLGA